MRGSALLENVEKCSLSVGMCSGENALGKERKHLASEENVWKRVHAGSDRGPL